MLAPHCPVHPVLPWTQLMTLTVCGKFISAALHYFSRHACRDDMPPPAVNGADDMHKQLRKPDTSDEWSTVVKTNDRNNKFKVNLPNTQAFKRESVPDPLDGDAASRPTPSQISPQASAASISAHVSTVPQADGSLNGWDDAPDIPISLPDQGKGCDTCGKQGHDFEVCPEQTCGYCNHLGHHITRCDNRIQQAALERPAPYAQHVCRICVKKGHTQWHCPERVTQQGADLGAKQIQWESEKRLGSQGNNYNGTIEALRSEGSVVALPGNKYHAANLQVRTKHPVVHTTAPKARQSTPVFPTAGIFSPCTVPQHPPESSDSSLSSDCSEGAAIISQQSTDSPLFALQSGTDHGQGLPVNLVQPQPRPVASVTSNPPGPNIHHVSSSTGSKPAGHAMPGAGRRQAEVGQARGWNAGCQAVDQQPQPAMHAPGWQTKLRQHQAALHEQLTVPGHYQAESLTMKHPNTMHAVRRQPAESWLQHPGPTQRGMAAPQWQQTQGQAVLQDQEFHWPALHAPGPHQQVAPPPVPPAHTSKVVMMDHRPCSALQQSIASLLSQARRPQHVKPEQAPPQHPVGYPLPLVRPAGSDSQQDLSAAPTAAKPQQVIQPGLVTPHYFLLPSRPQLVSVSGKSKGPALPTTPVRRQ